MVFGRSTATPAPAPDILEQKKNKLDLYNAQFDRAVSLVTDTIEDLGQISQSIQNLGQYVQSLFQPKQPSMGKIWRSRYHCV